MDELKIAQFCRNYTASKKEASEILKEVHVDYCIPLHPGKKKRNTFAGYTSLHFAAKKVAVDIISDLVEQGADLFKQGTADGCTPVHVAMNNIFSRERCDDEDRTTEEYKNFKSKELQEFSLVNTLLSKQVELNNSLNPKNKFKLSHLHIACCVNHSEAVRLLTTATNKESLDHSIDCGPDYDNEDFLQMNQLQGYTPLHCATKYLSVEAADILLQHGADIYAKNGIGMSCVHLLVDRITDMTDFMKMGKHTSCMSYIEEIEKIESIIQLVLKTSLCEKMFVDDIGFSALHLACTLRDKSIVEDLLKQNVDVNMPVKNESKFWSGWTPLHFAACFNSDIMILLMKNGADITIKNSKGETALDLCAKWFTPADIGLVLSTKSEFKDMMLSDNCTKLLDLLSAMNNYNEFGDFLQKLKDVNLTISSNSSIWAGYNLLHLSVSLNEKKLLDKNTASFETVVESYNCTLEEESLYIKRIVLCLQYGVSVRTKNAKGQTPIHLAFSMLREKAVVETLLSYSEEDIVDENGLSHLHIACALGQLDLVKRYLSGGAKVNSQVGINFSWHATVCCEAVGQLHLIDVQKNSTPLHVAVLFGYEHLVEYLLLEGKADVYAKDAKGFTPIHVTMFADCSSHKKSLARLLIKRTPNLSDSVSETDGLSHLHAAVCADCHEAVEKLLLAGAEVDRLVAPHSCSTDWYAGDTPLHVAFLEDSSAKVVKALLMRGANVHARDRNGLSVLQKSMGQMHKPCTIPLMELLKSGKIADVEASGITPLHFACADCDIDWIEKLLAEGADVNARIHAEIPLKGATPLYASPGTYYNCEVFPPEGFALAKLLVDNGADLNIVCGEQTTLHLMYEDIIFDYFTLDDADADDVETEMLRIANLLLDSLKSFDVNPVSSQGFSHFHFACVRNKVELVKKFLDGGVDVNQSIDPFTRGRIKDIGGYTPLHFASAYRSIEVAYVLVERGADVKARDANGNTPLHIAFKRKFVELSLVDTMLSYGADISAKNLQGETLFQCLLNYGGLTVEALEFFLKKGCLINIFHAHQGIIGSAMRSVAPDGSQLILQRLAQISEIESAIRSGFNVIQSIVSIRRTDELTVDNYLGGIQFLMEIGCELDQQDSEGRTALHNAVSFYNLKAVDALLQLGADVNVCNYANECPITAEIVLNACDHDETGRIDVVNAVTNHIWKMKLTGLYVNDFNLRCLEIADLRRPTTESFEQSCQDELTKAGKTIIDETLTVKDFLSEFGAVARFPRMSRERRAIVDKFFKCTDDLRREFPEFSALLAMQYRKALARVELHQPTKEAIAFICQSDIQEVCLEDIVRYFTNSEMKMAIESVKILFDHF